MQARNKGNIALAIARFREMIAEDPNLQPVRLHLAMALMADHQDEAARGQLEKLRSDQLPDDIRKIVDDALAALRERRSWTFNAATYYRYENNINGAPRERQRQGGRGTWTFPEPQKAHGIHVDLSAERRLPAENGWYAQFESSLNSDWYWNAHNYDDFRFRFGMGGGWQNARWDINLIPFIDVLLVILIFLMLTTTYSKFTELQLNLPSASADASQTRPKEVVVSVAADGRYMIAGQELPARDTDTVAAALSRAASAAGQGSVIVISADAQASHQSVITVMEAARRQGLTQLTFAAQTGGQ